MKTKKPLGKGKGMGKGKGKNNKPANKSRTIKAGL